MQLTYHGQHGPEVTIGNVNVHQQVTMVTGHPVEVDDDLGHRLLDEQPGTFTTGETPPRSATKDVWEAFRAQQGHDVEGLTKDELVELPDTPKGK